VKLRHRVTGIKSSRSNKLSSVLSSRSVMLYFLVSSSNNMNVSKLFTVPLLNTPVKCSVYTLKPCYDHDRKICL
jgi:hypothetical protein